MKPIVVRDQVRLGPVRCLQLTLAGIYYRFGRALITVGIVALAMAFLGYMLIYSVFAVERITSIRAELSQLGLLARWTSRLSAPDPAPEVVQNMVAGDAARSAEYLAWSGLSAEEFSRARAEAAVFHRFMAFLEKMRDAPRAVLLGDTRPFDLPSRLANGDGFAVFVKQLGELSLRVPLGGEDSLRAFVGSTYPHVMQVVGAIRAGHQAAIDRVRQGTAGRSLVEALAQSGESPIDAVHAAGFEADAEVFRALAAQSRVEQDMRLLTTVIQRPEIRTAIGRRLDLAPKLVDLPTVLAFITTKSRAREVRALFPDSGSSAASLSAERMLELARSLQRAQRLKSISANLSDVTIGPKARTGLGFTSMPTSMRWFILVSFLVCAVGICNTMFMSVTERFTEIATMKCLGAMDGFIMLLFVFESIIQGVVGSIVGIAVGFMLALARGAGVFGGLLFESLPAADVAVSVAVCFVLGIALASVAAIGPAWMATRLAPMEAMRVE